jgi:hypothetical protein
VSPTIHPLESLGTLFQGLPTPTGDSGQARFRLVNIRDLESLEVDGQKIVPMPMALHEKTLERHLLRENDILITTRTRPIRASVVTAKLENGIAGQNLAVLRPNNQIDPLYIAALFHSSYGKELADPHFKSSLSIPLISIGALKNLLVPIPPLETQRRIAQLVLAQERAEQLARAELEARRELVDQTIRHTLNAPKHTPED